MFQCFISYYFIFIHNEYPGLISHTCIRVQIEGGDWFFQMAGGSEKVGTIFRKNAFFALKIAFLGPKFPKKIRQHLPFLALRRGAKYYPPPILMYALTGRVVPKLVFSKWEPWFSATLASALHFSKSYENIIHHCYLTLMIYDAK